MIDKPIEKTLIHMTIPMVWGLLSIMMVNIVDTFFIGLLGAQELTAISFTFPVVFVVLSITMGLGIGVSAIVSHAIGKGDSHLVRRLTTDSMILALVVVAITSYLGVISIDPVFRLLGATPELLPLIHDYMFPWFIGIGFIVIPMVGNAAIRSTGDAKTPSRIMMLAGIANLLLDPILIFGTGPIPPLGMMGAALATIISYALTCFAALWVLIKRERMFDFSLPSVGALFNSWKNLLHIGAPAAGANMLMPITAGILTRMASEHGPYAVAAFGVGSRVESLAMIGLMALATVLTPFIGQNWAAGERQRVKHALNFSLRFSIIWGIGIALLVGFGAAPIAALFSKQPQVTALTIQFLWIVPISYGCFGVMLMVNATYNALHKPMHSAALIILRLFALTLPLAYVGSHWWGMPGMFVGICLGNIGIGITAYLMARRCIAQNAFTRSDEPIIPGIGNPPEQQEVLSGDFPVK